MYKLKIIPVNYLLNKSFLIPSINDSWWNEKQIISFLDSLLEVEKNIYLRKTYKIKPIIATQKDNTYWKIIDGKQRIIILYLILLYLKDPRKVMFETSNLFNILYVEKSRNIIKLFSDKPNILFFTICKIFLIIKNWFETNNINKADFLNMLLVSEYTKI